MTIRKSKATKRPTRFPPISKRQARKPMALVHTEAQLRIAAARVADLEGHLFALRDEDEDEKRERENMEIRESLVRGLAYLRRAERLATSRRRS